MEIAAFLADWLGKPGGAKRSKSHLFFCDLLMRCVFTVFACSVGLLPEQAMVQLLDRCVSNPRSFPPLISELWVKMNDPVRERRYWVDFDAYVPFFGGKLFHHSTVYALAPNAIAALREAAARSWAEVEPAIFGALLEGALDVAERRRLGAHYTPCGHVERMVQMVVMEPLRDDWRRTMRRIERAREVGALDRAQKWARGFHYKLRQVRVLDPACGTGNFLYIALELVKALEAEVLETLAELGAPELPALEVVDPRQFLGLEVNPRTAVIADLVLWIGFLQIHYGTQSGHPAEPIFHTCNSIGIRDTVLTWEWMSPGSGRHVQGRDDGGAAPSQTARLAGSGLHRRQPTLPRRQGPAQSLRRSLHGGTVGRLSADEPRRRLGDVVVGPRR